MGEDTMHGRVPPAPGSREPGPQAVPALSGFDPSRDDCWGQATPTPSSVEAMRPNLGSETDEPSLGEMVLDYYRRHLPIGEAFNLRDRYFAVLAEQFAENAKNPSPDDGVTIPAGMEDAPCLMERSIDDDCGCPEELWEAFGAHLHMHLSDGKPSNAHADYGDEGEAEMTVTAATHDLARAAIFGWAREIARPGSAMLNASVTDHE